MGAKVEFPIGKKLFHLVLNPGTSWCPTVDLELVQTTRNVNGTRHSVPGKTGPPFQIFHFFWEFSSGTSRRNVFHLPPNQKFRKFWLNGKRPRYKKYPCKRKSLGTRPSCPPSPGWRFFDIDDRKPNLGLGRTGSPVNREAVSWKVLFQIKKINPLKQFA